MDRLGYAKWATWFALWNTKIPITALYQASVVYVNLTLFVFHKELQLNYFRFSKLRSESNSFVDVGSGFQSAAMWLLGRLRNKRVSNGNNICKLKSNVYNITNVAIVGVKNSFNSFSKRNKNVFFFKNENSKGINITDHSTITVSFADLVSTHNRKDIYQNWLSLLGN